MFLRCLHLRNNNDAVCNAFRILLVFSLCHVLSFIQRETVNIYPCFLAVPAKICHRHDSSRSVAFHCRSPPRTQVSHAFLWGSSLPFSSFISDVLAWVRWSIKQPIICSCGQLHAQCIEPMGFGKTRRLLSRHRRTCTGSLQWWSFYSQSTGLRQQRLIQYVNIPTYIAFNEIDVSDCWNWQKNQIPSKQASILVLMIFHFQRQK